MNRQLRRLSSAVYQSLNTPRSLSVEILMRYGEWDQLANYHVDPHSYLDTPSGVEKYRKDVQAGDFLRKLESLPTSYDKKRRAVESFYESEILCFLTNERFRSLHIGERMPCEDAVRVLLSRAEKWISRVLGPIPARLKGRFGPGTVSELRGSGAKPCTITKCWTAPALTPPAVPIFWHATESDTLQEIRRRLGLLDHTLVRGNYFTTVPKDGSKDRGICIEPGGNLQLQLAVGGILKGRLTRIGIHLNPVMGDSGIPSDFRPVPEITRAETLHRDAAKAASLDSGKVTIDLSSASDTVSFELVRRLLPADWFSLLNDLRSPMTHIGGAWHHLDKFSSMGNGYTFELETLIFASLAYACGGKPGHDTLVYGDDIIVPSQVAETLLPFLRFCGFVPNPRKTFTSGCFRESCGGDFFCGVDVRPYQLKKSPEYPHEVAAVQQELVRRGLPWKPLMDMIPGKVLFGPLGFSAFAGPRHLWDVVTNPGGWSEIRVWLPVPVVWAGRFSDELHVQCWLRGGNPSRPHLRGSRGSNNRLVWLPA